MPKRYIINIDMPKINKFSKIAEKIEYELDFDYNTSVNHIETVEDFIEHIINPFENGERIYYRGEKLNTYDRTLIPTIYRHRDYLFERGELVKVLNADGLIDLYQKMPEYFDVYKKIIGDVSSERMYNFLAFSQHYFGISPLIDLTKSPYVALSFALKNRTHYDENPLIYTVEIKDENDYTNDITVADKWLSEYDVAVFNVNVIDFYEDFKFDFMKYKKMFDGIKEMGILNVTSPSAKLIDAPTNDLMRFQKGVFLLLNDFAIIGKGYLTKKVRDDFNVKKWIINKDICPELLDFLMTRRPYYNYDTITDLKAVVSNIKKTYMKG